MRAPATPPLRPKLLGTRDPLSSSLQTRGLQTVKNRFDTGRLAPSKNGALSHYARVIPYSEKCGGDAPSVLAGLSSASVRVSSVTAVIAGATSASIASVQASDKHDLLDQCPRGVTGAQCRIVTYRSRCHRLAVAEILTSLACAWSSVSMLCHPDGHREV